MKRRIVADLQRTGRKEQNQRDLLPPGHLKGYHDRDGQSQGTDVHDDVGDAEDHVQRELVHAGRILDGQIPAGLDRGTAKDAQEEVRDRVGNDEADQGPHEDAEPSGWA